MTGEDVPVRPSPSRESLVVNLPARKGSIRWKAENFRISEARSLCSETLESPPRMERLCGFRPSEGARQRA
jgi:hypothetical protein